MDENSWGPSGASGAQGAVSSEGATGAANTAVAGEVLVVGNRNIVVGTDKTAVITNFYNLRPNQSALNAEQAFERIAAATKLNLDQIQQNMDQARKESAQFFKLTLVFAALGFCIVLAGVLLLYLGETGAGVVATAASVIPELTAALFFHKDKELRATIHTYHEHMLVSQRLLTMIDVAETIQNPTEQDRMKQEIIMKSLVFK